MKRLSSKQLVIGGIAAAVVLVPMASAGAATRHWHHHRTHGGSTTTTTTAAAPTTTTVKSTTTTAAPTTTTAAPTTTTAAPTTTTVKPTTTTVRPTTTTVASGPQLGFPNASNTGVPAGTVLTDYTGPCNITVANTVIDAKTVTCELKVMTSGVKITRSHLTSVVVNSDVVANPSLTISDSEVYVGEQAGTGIGDINFTALRVHVHGGNRGINCFENCTLQDSYVHGQFKDVTGVAHESAVRMGSGSVIRHNTLLCDAPDVPPDAGCSADLTGYGDFAVVQNNTIDGNLFKATTGGACAYGGSSQGKPFSSGTNNIKFTNNVFERGTRPSDHGTFVCGGYFPVADYDGTRPGNVFTGNKWDDGTALEQ